MNFNVDEASDAVDKLWPWDLTLTVNGQDWATRRPSVADMGALSAIKPGEAQEDPDAKQKRLTAAFEAFAGIFCDPKPDVKSWGAHQVTGAMVGYLAYFNARSEKNSQAVAERAKSAMASI